MTSPEMRLLAALARMTEQYLADGDLLDNLSMSAGERALEVLAEHGLVRMTHGTRCGVWTDAGRVFLNSC